MTPLILPLSALRRYRACDLDARIAAFEATRCPPDPRLFYRPDAGRWPERGVKQELDLHQSTPFAPRPSLGTRTRPTHVGGSEHD